MGGSRAAVMGFRRTAVCPALGVGVLVCHPSSSFAAASAAAAKGASGLCNERGLVARWRQALTGAALVVAATASLQSPYPPSPEAYRTRKR